MKKLFSGLVIGSILAGSVFVYAAPTSWKADKATFKVMVRGEEFISENPAIAVEGRTYLPLRAMGDALGVNVEWNEKLKQAEVAMSDKPKDTTGTVKPQTTPAASGKTSWKADKATFKVMVRGKEFISENPAIVVEGRTYLPLRALGDALGVKVEWNDLLKQAEVDMGTVSSTPAPSGTTNTSATPAPSGTTNPSATPAPSGTTNTSATPAPTGTPVSSTAQSSGTLGITIGSAEAKVGTTIEIPINFAIADIKGVSTSDFDISYDAKNLEFVEATAGDIVKNADTNFASNKSEDGIIKVLYLNYAMTDDEAINTNGVFAKLKFKVKDTAEVGESKVEISGSPTFGDTLLKNIKTEITAGKITMVK